MTHLIRSQGLGTAQAVHLAAWPMNVAPQRRPLEGEIHIWRNHRAGKEGRISSYLPYLSLFEQQKAKTFHYEKDREDFILGRGILRKLLGQYLGVRAKDVDIRNNLYGKPCVYEAPIPLEFSVSQSGNEQVFVFTLGRQIGIDIEYIDDQVDFWMLAQEYFSKSEWNQLLGLPEEQRVLGFFKGWTQKEAYMKAIGEGYTFSSQDCDVLLTPEMNPQLIRSKHQEDVGRFDFLQIDIAKNYSCTVAFEKTASEGECPQEAGIQLQSFCVC